SLEDPFWNDLKEIAYFQRATLSQVVEEIARARQHNNLSSAIRLFVLDQVRMHGNPWRYSRIRCPAKRRISAVVDEAGLGWQTKKLFRPMPLSYRQVDEVTGGAYRLGPLC